MPIIIDPRTGLPFPLRTDRAPPNKRQGRVPGPADVAQIDAQVLRDPGVHATPEDFGAGIGKAVERFGKAASRVASDFAEMRREAEDDTAAVAGLSEARVRFTRVAESMQPQATTAGDFTGNLDRALGAETDAILRDLRQVRGLRPSKEGEAAIRQQLGVLASRMVVRGAMSEHRIRLAKLGHDVDASVADAAMAAFGAPADVFAIIAETEANLARFKDKLPPDILAAKVAAAREMIAGNAVAGLIEQGDVASARILLEAAGTGEGVSLSPDQAGRLRKAVDRVEDQARRVRRPAAEAKIEDHLASIQATGAGLGGVTECARAALDGKAFKAFERDEKDAHAFHETMKSLKFARPEVIEGELESRRPKRSAGNFAEKQRRFQVLERGAKQMLNVRARDGAAFVMEIPDVRAAFERAGDDGPDLRRALKFRMAMQSEIGMPEYRVRLLTRAEAGALASEVQSAATQDKAAKVAGLQDHYGPLFGRAMTELSDEGLDPRHRALAWARHTPALARTIAQTLEPGVDGPEKDLDAAVVKDVRDRLSDATAEDIKAVLSVAEDLVLRYLRETGDVEESAARTAVFANSAIEEILIATADGGNDQRAGGTGDGKAPDSSRTDQEGDGGKSRPDDTAGAPKAARGPDLTDIYRRHGVDPKSVVTLAKTGVVPQVEPEIDHKLVNLIRAIRDLNPNDGQAVHQLRKRIGKDLKGFPTRQHVFHFHLTRRLGGQSRPDTVKALAPQAVLNFGRQIDPKNAKLLADVLNVTPESELQVRRKINRRFGGLSGDAGIFTQTMGKVLRYRESGGKKGMSPKQAAEKLMPYVEGRKAEFGKNVLKGAATALTATKILPPLLARVIDIIDGADTAATLTGTKNQSRRVREIIGNGK